MQKKTVILDFDGTIADTLSLWVESYNDLAKKQGYRQLEKNDVEVLRSKTPQEVIRRYKINMLKAPVFYLQLRKKVKLEIAKTKPFAGIEEVLKEIKQAGFSLGILTSNSRENVEIFLRKNGMDTLFDFIYTGRNLFGKDKVIKSLLKKRKISLQDAVYVGDEVRDIEASQKVGIRIVSVSWGFNKKELLASIGPDQIADNPQELSDHLKNFFK